MSDAPKTIIVDFNGNLTASVISDVPPILGTTQYTLTASVAARLKAADELLNAIEMDDDGLGGFVPVEAIIAYRATKEIPE